MTAQLATRHGFHTTIASGWKRQAIEGLTAVFSERVAAHGMSRPR